MAVALRQFNPIHKKRAIKLFFFKKVYHKVVLLINLLKYGINFLQKPASLVESVQLEIFQVIVISATSNALIYNFAIAINIGLRQGD